MNEPSNNALHRDSRCPRHERGFTFHLFLLVALHRCRPRLRVSLFSLDHIEHHVTDPTNHQSHWDTGVRHLFLFGCWLFTAGCSRAHIVVTNQSGSTVSNLTISGSCRERHSDALAPQSQWFTVTPYHEGEIYFSFASAGVSYRTNVGVRAAFFGSVLHYRHEHDYSS